MTRNHDAIEATKLMLINAALTFVETIRAVLPEQVALKASAYANKGEVVEFVLSIRPYASEVAKIGESSRFWDMVDACNFYWDATGQQWPYISEESRTSSLKWSNDHAKIILSGH